MIFRYLTYLIKELLLRGLNYLIFPLAWVFRDRARENKGFLWRFLHDGCDYGDPYFLEKHGGHKTFWTAYKWAMRNPLHNYYYSHKITGKKKNYKGYATCQKPDKGLMWRTLKTCDQTGNYKDKHGHWIDLKRSVLGKQNITFYIGDKKYFRYSRCTPRRLFGRIWYCPEYKFGFESVNWAIQFKPIQFKKLTKQKITYNLLKLNKNER